MAGLDLEKDMIKALVESIRLSETVKPSQDAKRRVFRRYGFLGGSRDPLLTAVFYGVMLHMGVLDNAIRDLVGVEPYILDPWLRAGLRLLLEIIQYRDPSRRTLRHLRNTVASLLAGKTHPYVAIYYTRIYDRIKGTGYRYKPKTVKEKLEYEYLLPAWYVERIKGLIGDDEAGKLFESLLEKPPISVRVNTLKASVEEVIKALEREVGGVERSRIIPTILRFKGPYSFEKSRLWRKGLIIIQEEAAAAASIILDPKPGETIVDLAAAPGGKTEHMAELMGNKGVIHAFDINESRIERMKKILRRTGIGIVKIHREDGRRAPEILGEETADKVLLDAPCSSDGTIMKNPDLRWRLRPEKIPMLQKLQLELLESGWRLLRKAGRLLYCTCSLLREEDEEVIEKFLSKHPDAELVKLNSPYDPGFIEGTRRAWPHRHRTIGFFYALIEKTVRA